MPTQHGQQHWHPSHILPLSCCGAFFRRYRQHEEPVPQHPQALQCFGTSPELKNSTEVNEELDSQTLDFFTFMQGGQSEPRVTLQSQA